MPTYLKTTTAFLTKKRKNHVLIERIGKDDFAAWLKKQPAPVQKTINQSNFSGKPEQAIALRNKDGAIEKILIGGGEKILYTDGGVACDFAIRNFNFDSLKDTSFEFIPQKLDKDSLVRLHIGWGWGAYAFDRYKSKKPARPALLPSPKTDKTHIQTFVEAITLLRNLINTPANDMGPDELEAASREIAKSNKAEISVIHDRDLLKKNFPMIYAVGKGSARRPRLIEINWGNKKHPKLTLVGKGVCFDTGGLDIKPPQYMLLMKKDMGGAAHVLALAHLIIKMELKVRLRILIPAVENSISGDAFRPLDILPSRKGLSVEVGDTDAEGRLILADALTYACEEKPDLLIDFATLTGAARVALGEDLVALFANRDETAEKLKRLSMTPEIDDPVWPLPLWSPYRKDLDTPSADIISTSPRPTAGAINAALFMKEFVEDKTDWVHLDAYAWNLADRPARPKGGADTGLRTMFAYLEERYK